MTTEHLDLLPGGATARERAIAAVCDPFARLSDEFEAIRSADINPPSAFLPYLIWELGLGELSPYVPTLHLLISEGVRWQRVRGTPDAIARGLGFIGYAALLEEEPTRRKRWNRFQLELSRLRDAEDPDLGRIEGIAGLSVPIRSRFARGYRGYDIRACEAGYGRTGETLWGTHSGVRFGAGSALWSFGCRHELEHMLTEADLMPLGAWIVPAGDPDILWVDDTGLWVGDDAPWFGTDAGERARLIAASVCAYPVRVTLRDGDGAVIGHRLARSRPVKLSAAGEYGFGDGRYTRAGDDPTDVLVTARTDFGDGAGAIAASIELTLGGDLAADVGPGRLWLDAGDLSGATAIPLGAVTMPLGATVREDIAILLRI